MNRLTPWSNDPISDPAGEAVYLRDEATGESWTPTPLPRGAGATVTVRHGQGYTRYVRESHGLEQELLLLVPPDDPVKLACLTVRNTSDRPRRLTATYYAEWVLGTVRDNAPLQVVCEYDAEAGAVLARTAWGGAFAGRLAFLGVGARPHSFTADRTEFLGRHGSPAAPAALRRAGLTGRVGSTLDPCAAIMTEITLRPGQAEEVVFALGQADGLDEVRRIVRAYTAPGQSSRALAALRARWDGVLNAIQVRTPDPAIDVLVNRWLLYQVLACRVWARSAFYQSGGAYGFRDQLQDVMALVYGAPEETRAQILRSAARQFEEGDVQHWWHPPGGAGVRTRITDDLFFLPLVTHHYVSVTGDAALLDERIPYLKSPVLRPDQEEDYNVPAVSDVSATLYEHCVRVLEHVDRVGPHGLPLDGHRRLERRHEQGRRRRQGRERLERLVHADRPEGVRRAGGPAGRRGSGRVVPGAGRGPARRAGGPRLGRAVVPPGLLRRRHAARVGHERRMPDRRLAAGLVGDLRRGQPGPDPAGDGRRRRATRGTRPAN